MSLNWVTCCWWAKPEHKGLSWIVVRMLTSHTLKIISISVHDWTPNKDCWVLSVEVSMMPLVFLIDVLPNSMTNVDNYTPEWGKHGMLAVCLLNHQAGWSTILARQSTTIRHKTFLFDPCDIISHLIFDHDIWPIANLVTPSEVAQGCLLRVRQAFLSRWIWFWYFKHVSPKNV